jgi:choloylglycine hydrolase
MIDQPHRRRPRHLAATLAALVSAATLAVVPPATACTSFLLPTSDGSSVYGRTMEFGFEIDSEMIVIPRAYAFTGTTPEGKGLAWKGKYGLVGLNAAGLPVVVDGLNEKGLVGGILYFPGYAGYADAKTVDPETALAPWEVLTWALSSFATVAEVKAAIADIAVVGTVLPAMDMVPPLHFTFHDETGASLVVEPIDGRLVVYDNPVGVMTNSPSFDWHLTNLKNYVKMSPVNAEPIELFGDEFASFGQGSGLLGIPGDPTPPSRFIRAVGYAVSAERKPSGVESVRLAEHILNNFDIPIGFVTSTAGKEPPDYTQWSAIADLKNRRYYVKTYTDQVLRGVDLMSFDLDAEAIVTAPLTPQMEPAALAFPAK